jgi:glycosyltransferase involved in cell wall biosynthesis
VFATRSSGSPNRLLFAGLRALEFLTLRTATAVVATNESFRDNALRNGLRSEKITVVRNGPAVAEISTRRDADSAAVEQTGKLHHAVVYLGVLGLQDNVEGAVLAAERLADLRGRDDWRMIIAGDGERFHALTELVAERGLGDLVEFPGWLEAPEVDALLRSATVAIQPDLPTRMNDLSTMAKTVEYLARGVPVVAVDMTETRRSAGDAAAYVPTGDPAEFAKAIDVLLNDASLRDRMHSEGIRRFHDFLAWDYQAREYLGLWNRLFHGRRSNRFGRSGRGVKVRIPGQRIGEPTPAAPRTKSRAPAP